MMTKHLNNVELLTCRSVDSAKPPTRKRWVMFPMSGSANTALMCCWILSSVGWKNCFIRSISIRNIPSFDQRKSRLPNLFTA